MQEQRELGRSCGALYRSELPVWDQYNRTRCFWLEAHSGLHRGRASHGHLIEWGWAETFDASDVTPLDHSRCTHDADSADTAACEIDSALADLAMDGDRTENVNRLTRAWAVLNEPDKAGAVNLNDTMDATLWTREFCRTNPAIDKSTMLGWFANAIMAGYDEARRRYEKPQDAEVSRDDVIPSLRERELAQENARYVDENKRLQALNVELESALVGVASCNVRYAPCTSCRSRIAAALAGKQEGES